MAIEYTQNPKYLQEGDCEKYKKENDNKNNFLLYLKINFHKILTYHNFCYFSLGSTRFLKVARAKSREGLIVVKVFAIQDPSLPLAEHKERILKIKEQLVSANNCLPFQRVIVCIPFTYHYYHHHRLCIIAYVIQYTSQTHLPPRPLHTTTLINCAIG